MNHWGKYFVGNILYCMGVLHGIKKSVKPGCVWEKNTQMF